jgi:hypothetical protein
MRKYGIENFHIELIEETDKPEEREIYWIEQKRSFKNGYNATMGGDGKKYLDYDLIIATYKEVQNIPLTSKILNCSEDSISQILHDNNIYILSQQQTNKLSNGKIVKQYTKDGEFVAIYSTIHEAGQAINKPHNHISECINGKRKSAYGFIWKVDN